VVVMHIYKVYPSDWLLEYILSICTRDSQHSYLKV